MKASIVIIALLIAIAGCATQAIDIADVFHYNFSLINPPTGILSFEDEDLQFTFTPGDNNIKILFVNKSLHNAIIDWEGAIYIDKDGSAHRLITKRVEYKDKDKPQTPTAVAPKSQLVEWALPSDNVRRRLLGWKVSPMFPTLKNADIIETWDRTTFKVILPIEVDGESRHYEFKFKVKIR